MDIINYDDKYLDSLNELLNLSFQLKKVGKVADQDIELIAVVDDKVVGYLALNRLIDGIRGVNYFYVNYVCTHPNFRNQHIATKMFEKVFSLCKETGVAYLELTSNPKRVAAHHLYHKLGFQVRETDVFRKEIV